MIDKAICWKFKQEGITVIGGVITDWPATLGSKPTDGEILDISKEYANYIKSIQYKKDREKQYPNYTDQLDAIWKELHVRRIDGETLTQEADDILGEILTVKSKYPKPNK